MREIKTPWGSLYPEVYLFPIYYLVFMYGFIYILPFGESFAGLSWFDWFRSEDGINRGEGPLEWIQFFQYAIGNITYAENAVLVWNTVQYLRDDTRVYCTSVPSVHSTQKYSTGESREIRSTLSY